MVKDYWLSVLNDKKLPLDNSPSTELASHYQTGGLSAGLRETSNAHPEGLRSSRIVRNEKLISGEAVAPRKVNESMVGIRNTNAQVFSVGSTRPNFTGKSTNTLKEHKITAMRGEPDLRNIRREPIVPHSRAHNILPPMSDIIRTAALAESFRVAKPPRLSVTISEAYSQSKLSQGIYTTKGLHNNSEAGYAADSFRNVVDFGTYLKQLPPGDIFSPVFKPVISISNDHAPMSSSSEGDPNSGDNSTTEAQSATSESARETRALRDISRGDLSSAVNKRIQCGTCKAFFKRKTYLKKHINAVHLKIKPFKCPSCDRSFGYKGARAKHIRTIHQGLKPFRCAAIGCDMRFSEKGNMNKHFANKHRS